MMVYNVQMENNEQELSWGDLAEEWLKSHKGKLTASNPGNKLEELIEQNPELRVFRDVEGDIQIWVTLDGKKILITISRRVKNSYSSDIILTSQEIGTGGNELPVYTNLKLRELNQNEVKITAHATQNSPDLEFLLGKAKTGLEMVRQMDEAMNSDWYRFIDKVTDYSSEDERVKELVLGQMMTFIELYLDCIKK